jgi:ABC-type sugar transport system permease subunit/ABC-type glycerol-3-phosphate transport system substrate-binding protein
MKTLAGILVLLGSCLCGQVSGQPTEVTVFGLPDVTSASIAARVEVAVMQRFLELHPDVKLKNGSGIKIEGGANTMDMVPLMQIAGDISPDVIYVNFRFSETYIEKGFLKPLDKYIARMDPKELARRFPPAVRQVCYRKGPDGKMHWYAVPTNRLVRVMIYRRDLFAKAGLNPDRPPRTWDELEAYGRKLCIPAEGKRGIGMTSGNGSAWDFVNFAWSRGADIVAQDKNGEWGPRFNTQEMVDALNYYVRINCKKWKAPNGKIYRGVTDRDPAPDIMRPGDPIAIFFQYLDDKVNIYQPEILGFAPFPDAEPGLTSASEVNSAMFGMFAGVKDPKVERAAFEYLSFIDSDEANRIRVKMYIQRGFGKIISPLLLKQFGYTDYLKQVDPRWSKVYSDAMTSGKPEPFGKNCTVIYKELARPIEQALNDQTVISALDRGDEKAVKARLWEILNRAQSETAKRMFGILPAKIRILRHYLTLIFLFITASVFAFATCFLFKSFKRDAPPQTPGQKKSFYAYLLLMPAVAGVITWQYYPLMRGTIMAFQDYNAMGSSKFIGVANFSELLFDPNFWHSVYVTLLYTGLYISFAFVSPIVLALLLSEVPRGKILFRTIFYLPAVLSGLVMIFLWKSFYKPTGLLNTLLGSVGIHLSQSWLGDPKLAMIAVLLPIIWAGMGPGCLIYLAALKTIPEELYEAAEVDGAGIRRKIFNITLPSIKMLILINLVGAVTGAFMSSEMIFAMTGGGPYTPSGATEVVGLQLFYTAFLYLKFGLANAMGWVLGFMLIGFTMIQLRNLSRVEFKGGR